MYKATIVIPNINGKGWLKDSIESVYAQTEQNFRLIVVDNGSTDESLEQARSYCSRENFTLIENGTNTGFSHAVNQGIALADSEYVVLFNNDAFAEPQWLEELIRTAETDPKIFAVQSLMIRHFDRELADDAGDYVTWMGFACKTGDGRRASRYTRQKRIFSACGGAALKCYKFNKQGFGEAWDKGMHEAFALLKSGRLGKRPFRLKDLPNYILMELWMIWNMVPYLWYRLVIVKFDLK